VTHPIAQTGYGGTGEVRLSVYRDAIALWALMAGSFILACWGSWDILHRIQANDMTLGKALTTLSFFWLVAGAFFAAGIGEAITSLSVDRDNFILREHWLHTRRETRFAITQGSRPRIWLTRDDEGNVDYLVRVIEPGGRTLTIAKRRTDAATQELMADMNRIIDWEIRR
jgi:hypothetical protein